MLLLGIIVLLAGMTIGGSAQTTASNSTATNQSHTLEIIHINGSVNYAVTVSGTASYAQTHTEDTDNIAANTASGDVGGLPWETNSSDSKDVIRFTGEIYDFDINDKNGKIQVTLDGKSIDPTSFRTTPAPTAPSISPTVETATVTSQSPTHTVGSPQAPTHTPAGTTRTGTNLFSLTQIINTVVGLVVLALVGTAVVFYLRQ